MEGRAKVAYDPRDFDNSNEEQEQPKLTLMEEILLLGIKDKAVRIRAIGRVGNGKAV
jgi:Golgi phosphoprotein 3